MSNFAHLHCHSEWSLLDGALLIPKYVEHVKSLGQTACAVSDHGVLGALVSFYKECKKQGIHPVLGCESYLTDNPDDLENHQKTRDNMHAVLLAKDNLGYQRLLELNSHAALHNFYFKPRIYRDHLRTLGGHCVLTSACLAGFLNKKLEWDSDGGDSYIRVDKTGVVEKEIDFYLSVFKEDFYLELQVWPSPDQEGYNRYLLELGKRRGIPFVLTADCHYLKKEDYELHEMMMAMQLKKTLREYRGGDTMKYGPHFYVASSEEMLARAQSLNCEEAYDNTRVIAEKCQVELVLGQYKMPEFDITKAPDYSAFLRWKKEQGLG